ncbi:MAG: hypothetical protein VKK04_09925 [Synechococcales bacterium]|nr:hypothetical protein [Synechococcales bacterium]
MGLTQCLGAIAPNVKFSHLSAIPSVYIRKTPLAIAAIHHLHYVDVPGSKIYYDISFRESTVVEMPGNVFSSVHPDITESWGKNREIQIHGKYLPSVAVGLITKKF